MEITPVTIDKPEDVNVIIGQSHFIKTVEDLHESMAQAGGSIRFGVAFNEASGPRLVRRSGNDAELVDLAVANALAIGCGHLFVIAMRDGFPVNVLNAIKQVPEVCSVYAATANPLTVLVTESGEGRAVVGVVDGGSPLGVESPDDESARKELLRAIGYKL